MAYDAHIVARMAERGFFASTVRSMARRGLDTKANLERAYARDVASQARGERAGRRFAAMESAGWGRRSPR